MIKKDAQILHPKALKSDKKGYFTTLLFLIKQFSGTAMLAYLTNTLYL